MKSICVFCGSSKGTNPIFEEKAVELGSDLASRKINLVYGGGKVGLMGAIADACMRHGGNVTGIIPKFLAKKEIAHDGITKMIVVESMHQRKLKMSQLADGFIMMPGGYGTLEEFCEILTWIQLNLVSKPLGILNVDGYYNPLLKQFEVMAENGLLKKSNLEFFVSATDVSQLLDKMGTLSTKVSSLKDKFIHT
ncbi:MAG: TIGR00730 family Rossman fold protein [Cyclobacteriaceae bacterium]